MLGVSDRIFATPESGDDALDIPTAAARCGVSQRTIRRALDAGALDGAKVAGRWRVRPEALAAWQAAGGPTVRKQSTHISPDARRRADEREASLPSGARRRVVVLNVK